MNKLIVKLKQLWNISKRLDEIERQHDQLYKLIQERTEVHADVHWRESQHNVIVIGRYRNKDYVRLFDVEAESFGELVDMLARTESDSRIGRFDMPGNWPNVKAVVGRERF